MEVGLPNGAHSVLHYKKALDAAIAIVRVLAPVIGHGIGGIVIPAKMARLAKARCWSKR